jgi:hypothetical protein
MRTRKFYEDKRRLFDNADEMSRQLLRYQTSALALAASYVERSHAQDIFDQAVEYFLGKEMWNRKYYCLSAFRQMFLRKIHWFCLDLLKSPHYALERNIVALDTLQEDDHALIDQHSSPKALVLRSTIEEIWNSLTAQEQELFEELFYRIKPKDIGFEHGKSAKTISNKKSTLFSLIRQKYANGEYSFSLDELSALNRATGTLDE